MDLQARVSKVERIKHDGQTVITLTMMDELHERPSGTARRNFGKHRGRMVEGRHFFALGSENLPDEIRTAKYGTRGDTEQILLTERGYLLLVKSFRDDLAWQVQEAMIAQRVKEEQAKLANERMVSGGMVNLPEGRGTARDKAGEIVGISGSLIDHAGHVAKKGSATANILQ